MSLSEFLLRESIHGSRDSRDSLFPSSRGGLSLHVWIVSTAMTKLLLLYPLPRRKFPNTQTSLPWVLLDRCLHVNMDRVANETRIVDTILFRCWGHKHLKQQYLNLISTPPVTTICAEPLR